MLPAFLSRLVSERLRQRTQFGLICYDRVDLLLRKENITTDSIFGF
jgi:hypothetical protein